MDILELNSLITNGEGQYLEFKRLFSDADNIAAEIVAFLNSEGGILLFGVEDDGQIYGANDSPRLRERVLGVCRNNCVPTFVPTIEEIEVTGKAVLAVHIPKGADKPYCTNRGLYYIRADNQKRRTSKEELGRLFQSAGFVHYDTSAVPGTTMDDLDSYHLERYFAQVYDLDLHKSEISLERLLINAHILSDDGDATVGGILFFALNPSNILFQAGIMVARYNGNEISAQLLRTRHIDAPLPEMIDQALEFVMNNTAAITTLESARRVEITQYPETVVREAITNAVAHRNYSISGSRVTILIFDNRIEIKSPGRLPNTVTLENIRYGVSFSRNQFIVKLLNNYGYIEILGQGVPLMIREMRHHAGREPDFAERGEEFIVTLYGKELER